MYLFAFSPGPLEIIIVLVILILLFGKRLPEVGKSLGKGFVEFKKGVKGIEREVKVDVDGAAEEQLLKEDTKNDADVIVCSNCGGKNTKDAVFCSECGHRIAPI
ncbi:MAG: twin-arginine translocase TatA/TatE family subunit [Planctomycetes bacterium]|nr:twin-arginine translocase TatA/TatE family subunit [Planctomycetota bacterium]